MENGNANLNIPEPPPSPDNGQAHQNAPEGLVCPGAPAKRRQRRPFHRRLLRGIRLDFFNARQLQYVDRRVAALAAPPPPRKVKTYRQGNRLMAPRVLFLGENVRDQNEETERPAEAN